jgi:hypothetical protein
MFHFEKISLNQILSFSEVINNLSLLRLDLVKAKYLKTAQNFNETAEFLKEIALIKIKNNQIIPTKKYENFLNKLRTSKLQRKIAQKFILKSILSNKHSFSEYINEYLSYFQMSNKQYEFTPTAALRLKYKGIRNILMDLEFIYFDNDENKYFISDNCLSIFTLFKDSQLLSIHEFIKIREKKEKIGREAELQTILYEKNRLSQLPSLAKEIEHTAIRNIEAGYDIKSFECELDKVGNPVPRYIEVKAVSSWDYKFYWTKNEIEKAKYYKNQYYLYLLPVDCNEKFNFEAMKIFCDPYSNIYKKEKTWVRTEELLSFLLAPHEKNKK